MRSYFKIESDIDCPFPSGSDQSQFKSALRSSQNEPVPEET